MIIKESQYLSSDNESGCCTSSIYVFTIDDASHNFTQWHPFGGVKANFHRVVCVSRSVTFSRETIFLKWINIVKAHAEAFSTLVVRASNSAWAPRYMLSKLSKFRKFQLILDSVDNHYQWTQAKKCLRWCSVKKVVHSLSHSPRGLLYLDFFLRLDMIKLHQAKIENFEDHILMSSKISGLSI